MRCISLCDLDDRHCHACCCNPRTKRPSRRMGAQRYAGCILLCEGQKQTCGSQHVVSTLPVSFSLPCFISLRHSLIYQLLDYEKAIQGGRASPVSSDLASSPSEEDREWGRRRNAFAEEGVDLSAVQQEASALDRAMEERLIARKSSASSLNSGMGMGSAWRCRYGRKRTGSIASIHTAGSIFSEDLVEADEESELLGVGGPFDDVLEPRRSPSLSSESPGSPSETTAQTTHLTRSYTRLSPPPTAPPTKLSFNVSRPPANLNFKIAPGKSKRRPLPLGTLPPVPPSPSTPVAVQESKPSPRRRKHLSARKPPPPPLKLQSEPSSIAFPTDAPPSKHPVSALPSQTLFVFPPSPTVTPKTAMRTPATMTITSNVGKNTYPFPPQTTPRVATSRTHGRTRSFIGLGTSVAPTTAYSRVDARGWVGLE